MNGNLEPEDRVLSEPDWLEQVYRKMNEIGMEGELEVVLGGTQVYEIEGAGTKWAPVKGTRKYDKDCFIIIRRPRETVSSLPMEDFSPGHDPYEYDYEDAPNYRVVDRWPALDK